MLKHLDDNEISELQIRYLTNPLFCSLTEVIDLTAFNLGSISSVEIWHNAEDVYKELQSSHRPDLMIPSLFSKCSRFYGSDDLASIVMTCTLYIICSTDGQGKSLTSAAQKIGATVIHNPLIEYIFNAQREAEKEEESNGNPIPADLYKKEVNNVQALSDPDSAYCTIRFDQIPDDLKSCVGDKRRFDQYCRIINGEILSYIKSPEGYSQLWKVVLEVSKDLGYISQGCNVRRFGELLHIICPDAGEAHKLDQNMQKKIVNQNEKDAIRSRFGL